MLVILPFEPDFYQERNFDVEYVGHPLVQVVDDFLQTTISQFRWDKPVVALLPGSRKQEITVKLPVMLRASRSFPEYQFVVAKAASLDDSFYETLLKDFPNVRSVHNKTYELLSQSTAALVTSGTATLETALFGIPQVVCYKGSAVSYAIARRLVKIKYISLVNLIMNRQVVTELIQHEMNESNLVKELKLILYDEKRKIQIRNDYRELKNLLQQGGNASARAAASVLKFMSSVRKSV
jgi:lipid-A-disaccharide synthase